MFQPTSTPLSFQTSYGVANANIPDYTFAPTPLGQAGSTGGAAAGDLSADAAANVYASPIFQSLLDNNQQHHSPRNNAYPQHQTRGNNFPASHTSSYHNIKMEPPSDLAQQEAAARDYKPDLEVGSLTLLAFLLH
jgi:ubiquitin thioesterase protein OTUB1